MCAFYSFSDDEKDDADNVFEEERKVEEARDQRVFGLTIIMVWNKICQIYGIDAIDLTVFLTWTSFLIRFCSCTFVDVRTSCLIIMTIYSGKPSGSLKAIYVICSMKLKNTIKP